MAGIDGSGSNFTKEKNYTLDTFKEIYELSQNDIVNVKNYKTRKANGESTESILSDLTSLAPKIVTSEDWNLLLHAMFNLEKAYVDKGLDQIDSTVKNYVKEYAETDINKKLGTIINNLLLTNATQIIISDTQPTTVTNGALWIKPKTN